HCVLLVLITFLVFTLCFFFTYSFRFCSAHFFFLILRPPPRTTLFPYTTLFRSIPAIRSKPPPDPNGMVPRASRETYRPEPSRVRSEEHTSELQSRFDLVCRLLLEKKNCFSIALYSLQYF